MSITTPERNLSNTPALKAIYDAMRAVENCGGSVQLTAALNAVAAIGPHVHGFMDALATLTAEVERKQAALVELIACKDLMGIIETLEGQTSPWTEGQNMQYVEAKKHYERRKPLAWTAARRAVLPVGGEG